MAVTTDEILAAERHLSRRDPVLRKLIARHRPCTLVGRRRDPFHVLCTSIVSQQLSTKAADTIQGRVMAHVNARRKLEPRHIIGTEHEALRACGLSHAKARWLRALAEQVHSGEFSFARLRRMDDESAIEALDALPGIGRWTAEMYLIFALHRLDIFAMDDVGLRRSVNRLYNGGEPLDDDATLALTERWKPYRSVASWYLWRLIDGDVAA
ncbi:MAG: DNA-3-methyladenine glycosylase 2 family protein [Nevskiaceae bacterium]|nr:MAG: DNA-3-methyladenine glycosylase 2 family protein [Nevskiaceae bacterium]